MAGTWLGIAGRTGRPQGSRRAAGPASPDTRPLRRTNITILPTASPARSKTATTSVLPFEACIVCPAAGWHTDPAVLPPTDNSLPGLSFPPALAGLFPGPPPAGPPPSPPPLIWLPGTPPAGDTRPGCGRPCQDRRYPPAGPGPPGKSPRNTFPNPWPPGS